MSLMDSSAFWDAIDADDATGVDAVVAAGGDVDARSRANSDGLTPLHYAAQRGSLVALEAILRQVRVVDAGDRWGSSPLHVAVVKSAKWGTGPVRALLEAGADPLLVNDLGITPLSQAQNLAGVPDGLVEMLSAPRLDDGLGSSATPLLTAAQTMDAEAVVEAIQSSDGVNTEHDDDTPLRAVVRRSLPPRPNRPNPHPFDLTGAKHVAEQLIGAGANVRLVHADGFTAQGVARSFLAPNEITGLLDDAAKNERS